MGLWVCTLLSLCFVSVQCCKPVWTVDRNRSDRLVRSSVYLMSLFLPLSLPFGVIVSASRGAIPSSEVWYSAQREHGKKHPLQLSGHAPVHGQIQPERSRRRHTEPQDWVCLSFCMCFCFFTSHTHLDFHLATKKTNICCSLLINSRRFLRSVTFTWARLKQET